MLTILKKNQATHLRLAIKLIMLSALSLSATYAFSAPDEIQINDKNNTLIDVDGDLADFIDADKSDEGGFDLSEDDSSSIVSAATGPVAGNYPGIRTAATVNNLNDELRVCATVKVNFQILDIDGDWDQEKTLPNAVDGNTTYQHLSTTDTIKWFFIDPDTNEKMFITQEMRQELGLTRNELFTIPEQINFNGTMRSTIGLSLGYEITPWTMYGSVPRTLGEIPYSEFELSPDIKPIVVEDITAAYRLAPNSFDGELTEKLSINTITVPDPETAFNYSGLTLSQTNGPISFIKNRIIQPANPDDCIIETNEKYQIQIFDTVTNKVLLENEDAFVNREYTVKIGVWNETTQQYEDQTESLNDYITWSLYQFDESGNVIDIVKHMTANGYMNVPEESEKLAAFDPNAEGIFTKDENIQNRFTMGNNMTFKTQENNENTVNILKDKGPNFSEQGLKMRVYLVLPNQS